MFARARWAFKATGNVFRNIQSRDFSKSRLPRVVGLCSPIFRTGGVLCAAAVITSQSDNVTDENSKLKAVDPETLTSSYLIRNAAKVNVDSATTLLTQTATTLLEVHEKYVTMLDQLLKLHEMTVQAHGVPHMEERVADTMLVTRKELADIMAAKQELEILHSSVERLVTNAAEVAFFSGADHACTIANERLFATREKLNSAIQNSRKAELSLREYEAWIIAETVRREEEIQAAASITGPRESATEPQDPGVQSKPSESEPTTQSTDSVNDTGITDVTNPPPPYKSSGPDEDWFSVVLGDEGSDSSSKSDSSQSEEQEDERKWANTK